MLNRGNGKQKLFYKAGDFAAFLRVLAEGVEKYPVEILCYCLMSNHWHLVLRPKVKPALGRFMGWVGVTHVRRYQEHYHERGGGHLYQGRFKSFPIQDDRHFLTVCRYVEANPLRAGMVKRAEEWAYSSLGARVAAEEDDLGEPIIKVADWPVPRPRDWVDLVNQELPAKEMEKLHVSVKRGRPYGTEVWARDAARRMGLEHTFREAGRPKKKAPRDSAKENQ